MYTIKIKSSKADTCMSDEVEREFTPNKDIWEMQPWEQHVWYVRFMRFLQLGSARSILAVYEQEKYDKYVKNGSKSKPYKPAISYPRAWREIPKIHFWHKRVQAYDLNKVIKMQVRLDSISDLEAINKAKERRLEIVMVAIEKVGKMILECNSASEINALANAFQKLADEQRTDYGVHPKYLRFLEKESGNRDTEEVVGVTTVPYEQSKAH